MRKVKKINHTSKGFVLHLLALALLVGLCSGIMRHIDMTGSLVHLKIIHRRKCGQWYHLTLCIDGLCGKDLECKFPSNLVHAFYNSIPVALNSTVRCCESSE